MGAKQTSGINQPPDLSSLCLALTEHAPLPMATVEGATHIVRYVNPAFCRLMDKPVEQLIGTPLYELLPKKDTCVTLLDRVFRTGKPESHTEQEDSKPHPVFWSYTMWPLLADEHLVGVMIQVTETAQFHGKTIAMNEELMLGSVRQHQLTEAAEELNEQLQAEIAERRQAEAALRESEERYRNLFNSIDEGFCVIEMIFDELGRPIDYKFLEVNPSFEKQTGLHNAVGKRMRELVPNHEAYWFEIYGNVALSGEPIRFANEAKALNDRWFDVYAFRIGGQESRKVALLFNNITERKKIDEALRVAKGALTNEAIYLERVVAERTAELTATNKQLEAFVYSIAHDLRAPLRSMQGFSELLLEESGEALSETGRDYAGRIDKSAQFMDAMLGDMLAFSHVSQQRVELTSVSVGEVVESVLSRLQNDIQEKNARVENLGPWSSVLAHEPTLTQVLFNLVNNALKFLRPGVSPLIHLRAEEKAEFVRVWVEDNGIGIAPGHQDQIFRIFTRLRGDSYPGTGIGLAIVQKGIERMGGRVGVESAPGQGSRFWFALKKA